MRPRRLLPATATALVLLSAGCSLGGTADRAVAPRTRESDLVSLYLTGNLEAPDVLSRRVAGDLATIRQRYGRSRPEVRRAFVPPWEPGTVVIRGPAPAADSLAALGVGHWADVSARLRPTAVEAVFGSVFFAVADDLHPVRVAEAYAPMTPPEFSRPRFSAVISVGGAPPPLYVGRRGDRLLYLFVQGGLMATGYTLFESTAGGRVRRAGAGAATVAALRREYGSLYVP